MNFAHDESHQAVADLAAQIFGDHCTHERLRALESSTPPRTERFDAELWGALGEAGLLSIAVPEADGGAGLGFLAAALVALETGRGAASVPTIEHAAVALPAIAEFGTADQRAMWLADGGSGSAVWTVALAEVAGVPLGTVSPSVVVTGVPAVVATSSGDGWSLTGEARFVASGEHATWVLVPVTVDGGVGVAAVERSAAGISSTLMFTNTGTTESHLTFDDVAVPGAHVLAGADRGAEVVEWMVLRATAATAMAQAGAAAAALALMAEYAKTREQFGKAIATFQAVGQRAADAYVDTEAIRLSALQAAWQLDVGRDARDAVAIAKFWAADGGQRVVHAANHIHGGIGVDRDYPLHRSFLAMKHYELMLGGATEQLRRLGAAIAAG